MTRNVGKKQNLFQPKHKEGKCRSACRTEKEQRQRSLVGEGGRTDSKRNEIDFRYAASKAQAKNRLGELLAVLPGLMTLFKIMSVIREEKARLH
ncbi:hypothetical protein BaRGS_00037594 [Batillaria attramentaria]|uniref:BHLH domain-containing protein n=1 Tax=Batillaria attramentaria TaxID=370345 RepID=A0ABD0J8Q9_9CAEN